MASLPSVLSLLSIRCKFSFLMILPIMYHILTPSSHRFGIELAAEVVKADGNVRNLAWRICNAKKVLVSSIKLLAEIWLLDQS